MSVNECVCVSLSLKSSKTVNSNDLNFCSADGFRLKKPSGFDQNFARKSNNNTSKNPPYHLILFISNFPLLKL